MDVRKSLIINQKTQKPLLTIDNFLTAMQMDCRYANIKFNEVSNRAEIHGILIDGKPAVKKWSDADDAASQNYMEQMYSLYSPEKHDKALRILFEERRYNPILDVVDPLVWDGVERCEHFLHVWAKCEDSSYTREVSRLIFAGGINRLYEPGKKFDDVPIFIGTRQGEGKSSLIRWIAIRDEWFGEAGTFEGQQSIEQLEGKWICEISELLALTKTKEQEAAKAYLARQVDTYRKPWDRNVSELPRRCIFIGTSNDRNPLTDKTGNRRYYPIEFKCSGYDLFDHEEECRAYILQCWAEAKEKYKAGKMPNYADRRLVEIYRQQQEDAVQDDWRVGAVLDYLERKNVGELVCVRELFHKALSWNPDFPKEPSLIESKELGRVMNKAKGWAFVGRKRIPLYGQQQAWMKTGTAEDPGDPDEGSPGVQPLKPLDQTPPRREETAPIWDEDEDLPL